MNKHESYKPYILLMISSDGKQNNVFSISVALADKSWLCSDQSCAIFLKHIS